ncbi:MAG: transglutaminase-like cysteine peptidase [Alphaproteobacteria bacterium]
MKYSLIALLNIIFFANLFYASSSFATSRSYFSMSATRSENLQPFPKWTSTLKRFGDQQKLDEDKCDTVEFHPCAIKSWKEMIASVEGKNLREQLDAINTWGNEHPYIVDQLNWGMEDFWETPHEFISVNGDCEDYAIAKYYSLKALGVSLDKMRIIIVQDFNLGGIIHAILGVYDEKGDMYILDNQIDQVMPAMKIYHYRPIYSLNEDWWWAYYQ